MKIASLKFHLKAQLPFHVRSNLRTLYKISNTRIHDTSSPLVNLHLELFLELAIPCLKTAVWVYSFNSRRCVAMEVLLFMKG